MADAITGFSWKGCSVTSLEGKTIDISNSIKEFDYFEDILQPAVTAAIRIRNSYGIVNQLPIRGGEKVDIELVSPFGDSKTKDSFDITLYVYKVTGIDAESTSEESIIHLITSEYFNNQTSSCMKKYFPTVKISDHVKDIIDNVLYANNAEDKKDISVEPTANTYGFIGSGKKPFHALEWLGVKSISTLGKSGVSGEDETGENKGTAGFLFYENNAGYHFRSIDSLVSGAKVGSAESNVTFSYYYKGKVIKASDPTNNVRIINFNFEKNIDFRHALNVGLYCNDTIFYDTYTNKLSRYHYNLKKETKDATKLGKQGEITLKNEYADVSSRTFVRLSDHGVLGVDGVIAKSGRDDGDVAKSFSRYNLLFTQALNILVPCNTKLKVGDVIYCEFPKTEGGETKEVDPEVSGNYIIRELRHHVSTNQNTSSLKLMRDSYGLYGPDE